MLVLGRRSGQGIRIGDSIRISVISVDGQFVRLGIEAPASSKILREELWRAVADDNLEAAAAPLITRAMAQMRRNAAPPKPE